MKKLFFVLVAGFVLSLCSFAQNQTFNASDLPADVLTALQNTVDPILSQCCYDFKAKDYFNSSITTVKEQGRDQLQIKGKVSYHGNHCDFRINTTYTIVLNPKDGDVLSRCIITPTCLFGASTGDVEDCKCTEYMTTEQKATFVRQYAPVVIDFMNKHQ